MSLIIFYTFKINIRKVIETKFKLNIYEYLMKWEFLEIRQILYRVITIIIEL